MIENNRFYKLWGPALLIEDDCNFWFESGLTKNIVFKNNDVISCNFGKTRESSPVIQCTPKVMNEEYDGFVHEKLTVTGNRFLKSLHGSHSFWLEYLKAAEITDNFFDEEYKIHCKNVGNILENGNKSI